MREQGRGYLVSCGCDDDEAQHLASASQLVVWCSVHPTGSRHPNHVHTDAMISGVYYAATPPGSGDIVFEDPRGLSPFARSHEHAAAAPFHRPHREVAEEGKLVLFPSWLVHRVEPGQLGADEASEQDTAFRVSYSFNFIGRWDGAKTTPFSVELTPGDQ